MSRLHPEVRAGAERSCLNTCIFDEFYVTGRRVFYRSPEQIIAYLIGVTACGIFDLQFKIFTVFIS